MRTYFTSESVCAGHPDKIADQISDAVLNAVLSQDPAGRVAVETLVTENKVILAGEISANAKVYFRPLVRRIIRSLGYKGHPGFNEHADIEVLIHQQSGPLRSNADQNGAGDQGMMFGYACNETPELMPLPITLVNRLAERLDQVKTKELPCLRPDGKTQVTVAYEGTRPVEVTSVVIAVPFKYRTSIPQLKRDLHTLVVTPILTQYGFRINYKDFIFNNAGAWFSGGPAVDTGLTGRKIIVDTYGGYARVGGGAFSGKDPTKVDRSGAYAARFLAKNIVAAGLAERAEVGLAYVIGGHQPVMTRIETFGTAKKPAQAISDFASNLLDPSVSGIISKLKLNRPIYLPTAAYGHFGRDGFPWEEIENPINLASNFQTSPKDVKSE